MKKEKQEVMIELSEEKSDKFGMMGKLTFENGSAIYIFNGGWHLKHPDDESGLTLPWAEVNLAINNSFKLGYVNNKGDKHGN